MNSTDVYFKNSEKCFRLYKYRLKSEWIKSHVIVKDSWLPIEFIKSFDRSKIFPAKHMNNDL